MEMPANTVTHKNNVNSKIMLCNTYMQQFTKISLSILTATFPSEPGLASFIEAKDDASGGDNWSYKKCTAPVKLSPPTNQHLIFTGRCPSCHPTNSVTGLKRK